MKFYCSIFILVFLFSNFSLGQSALSYNIGLTHNSIIKEPDIKTDTAKSLTGPKSFPYPCWNYSIGATLTHKLFKKYSAIMIWGLEFDKYSLVYRTDSNSARLYTNYFPNPPIETEYKSASFSLPVSIGYKYKNLAVDLGLKVSFISWENQKSYLLDGTTKSLDTKNEFAFHLHFICGISYKVFQWKSNKFDLGIRIENKPYVGYDLNYYKLVVIYSLTKI